MRAEDILNAAGMQSKWSSLREDHSQASQNKSAIQQRMPCSAHLYEELWPLPLQAIVVAQLPDSSHGIVHQLHVLLSFRIVPRLLWLWIGLHHDGRLGGLPTVFRGNSMAAICRGFGLLGWRGGGGGV